MKEFQKFIRFLVSIFASSEFAFIYCILGTLAQTSHTYYLIESISSLSGWGKHLQAIGLSIFISSSLLFFTAIANNDKDSKDYKRVHFAVNLFMVIEIIINIYYYASHLIIKSEENQVFDFIFALLVSCLIPVTIKLYAGIIDAKKWFEEISNEELTKEEIVEKPIIIKEPVVNQQEELIEEGETNIVGPIEVSYESTVVDEINPKKWLKEISNEKNETDSKPIPLPSDSKISITKL